MYKYKYMCKIIKFKRFKLEIIPKKFKCTKQNQYYILNL